MGLASLFSDWNHEMATALLPVFLSTVLGAPAFALGLIEGMADGVSTLFQIWSGWYSDRIGKRKGLAVVSATSSLPSARPLSRWREAGGRC